VQNVNKSLAIARHWATGRYVARGTFQGVYRYTPKRIVPQEPISEIIDHC